MEKDNKKEERALKRDARLERKYGNPVLRKLADFEEEDSHFRVAGYYYRFRNKRCEAHHDTFCALLFFVLAFTGLILCLVTTKDSWSVSFGIDGLFGLYFLLCARMCDVEGDRFADKLISLSTDDNKKKAVEALAKEKKDGSNAEE